MEITLLYVGVLGNLVIGFTLGKWYERLQWNSLIRRGVIPAPKVGRR